VTSPIPPAETEGATEHADAPRWRSTLTAVARLGLVAVYALTLLSLDAMHFEAQVDYALIAVAAVLWIIILGIYWRGLARTPDRRGYALSHAGVPLLLVAPLLVIPNASWILLLLLLTAYILELRGYAAGHGFMFSFGLVAFVIVLATGLMSYVERESPDSDLDDVGAAAAWSFATIFRLRPMGTPRTEDGQTLALLVGVCALLAASLFTAQIVTWVTGSGREKKGKSDPSPELLAEISALRQSVDELNEKLGGNSLKPTPPHQAPAPPTSST
jgi:hypothetical protein